jgi:hypothetical protein
MPPIVIGFPVALPLVDAPLAVEHPIVIITTGTSTDAMNRSFFFIFPSLFEHCASGKSAPADRGEMETVPGGAQPPQPATSI